MTEGIEPCHVEGIDLMDIYFRCTDEDFIPPKPCDARWITAEEWRENGKRWGLYADWGPQLDNIERIYAKGEHIFVVFEGEQAIACAGRLPRSAQEDEVDSVWVRADRRGEELGRQIVAFVTKAILEDGKVALYSTRDDNIPSLRVAEAVGFQRVSNTDQ